MVGLGDRLHDGQAKSGGLGVTQSRAPPEPLEQLCLLLRWDAGAAVADPRAGVTVGYDRAQPDRRLLAAVPDGVLGELDDGLGQPLPVGHHHPTSPALQLPSTWGQRHHLSVQLLGERPDLDDG